MTITNLEGLIQWPEAMPITALGTHVLSSSTAKTAAIMQAPATGSLSRVAFRTATAGTGTTLRISIQTVGTDGLPTGTLLGTGAEVTLGPTPGIAYQNVALGTPVSVTRGQLIAVVITVDTFSSSCTISRTQPVGGINGGIPYCALATTGAYSKVAGVLPNMALMIGGVWTVGPGNTPAVIAFGSNTTTASTPDEVGVKITMPFGCRAKGVWMGWGGNTSGSWDMIIYNASNTVLKSITLGGGEWTSNVGAVHCLLLDSDLTLAAGDVIRIVVKPTSGTTVSTSRGIEVTSTIAGLVDLVPGGTSVVGTQRTDAGSWTDSQYTRSQMGLLIDGIDMPVASTRKVKVGGAFVTA